MGRFVVVVVGRTQLLLVVEGWEVVWTSGIGFGTQSSGLEIQAQLLLMTKLYSRDHMENFQNLKKEAVLDLIKSNNSIFSLLTLKLPVFLKPDRICLRAEFKRTLVMLLPPHFLPPIRSNRTSPFLQSSASGFVARRTFGSRLPSNILS